MKIEKKLVTVAELAEGYTDYTEVDIERGVFAYNGKLQVRPPFQRSFVYDAEQENAVINTVLKGFPLNTMYWVDNHDGTYNCLDGQQRTISLCKFIDCTSSFIGKWMPNPKQHYNFNTLKRIMPDLMEDFLNYPLEIYICNGTKQEQLEWFQTINIAGEKLSPQELRNANYTGKWLTEAKKYFSRANTSSTALCPAERVGNKYTKKDANRQGILEQVLTWIVDSNKEEDICQYMEEHCQDDNANELCQYWENVINWVDNIFVGVYHKDMRNVNWGKLYNKYKDQEFNPEEICEEFEKLFDYVASKELTISVAKICEYCITKDKTLLKHRIFSEIQKQALYNRQNGICPDCGKHFLKTEMVAHHIIPWYNDGITEISNGVMLCKECHIQRHL